MSRSLNTNDFFDRLFKHLITMITNHTTVESLESVFSYGIRILHVHPKHWSMYANYPDFQPTIYTRLRKLAIYNFQLCLKISNQRDQFWEQIGKESNVDEINKIETVKIIHNFLERMVSEVLRCPEDNEKIHESKYLSANKTSQSCHCIFSTNVAEGQANAQKAINARDTSPVESVDLLLNHHNESLDHLIYKYTNSGGCHTSVLANTMDKLARDCISDSPTEIVQYSGGDENQDREGPEADFCHTFHVKNKSAEWDVTITYFHKTGPEIRSKCSRHHFINQELNSPCQCVPFIFTHFWLRMLPY